MFTTLMGTIRQGLVFCQGTGFQCTVISFVASVWVLLGLARLAGGPNELSSAHIDSIDVHGSRIYDELLSERQLQQPVLFGHDEMPSALIINLQISNIYFVSVRVQTYME